MTHYLLLTATTAARLVPGQWLQHADYRDRQGRPLRVKVTRKTQYWRHMDARWFSVMVYWEPNLFFALTHENAVGWLITEECDVGRWPQSAVTHLVDA